MTFEEKLAAIKRALDDMSRDELAAFREWFAEYGWQRWDQELEEDVAAGKLDRLAAEALDDFKKGRTKPL